MSEEHATVTRSNISTSHFIICANDGRRLLNIDLKTGEVTGEITDAGEAAEVFVREIHRLMNISLGNRRTL